MKSQSVYGFYYVFPQLLRYFKNENPAKAAMDCFYSRKLKDLTVIKNFIIHSKQLCSDILHLIV